MSLAPRLKELLTYTRDGEWGKGEPAPGLAKVAVIRGTDFDLVRHGELSALPRRWIPSHVLNRKRLQVDDILLETAGGTKDQPTGRTVLLKERIVSKSELPLVCASFSRFLRVDQRQIDPGYLYWFLQDLYARREMYTYHIQHTGVARFQYTQFAEAQTVPILPRREQKAIAAVLGALDDKIELNRRMNRTLEAMARALFRSWFVDFDPVHAKAEGRAPAQMDSSTAELFPARFADDGLPDGWRAGAVSEIADLNPEKWSKRRAPDRVVYVDLSNTKWGSIESTNHFAWADAPSRAQMVLRIGDTIVGTVRPGNGSFSYIAGDGLTGSTGFAVLRPKSLTDAALVYLAATDQENIERLANLADGAAYPAVSPSAVVETPLVSPSVPIRLAFAAIATPMIARAEAGKDESRTLATLRDVLLPKLMSGEVRVGDTERALAEVA